VIEVVDKCPVLAVFEADPDETRPTGKDRVFLFDDLARPPRNRPKVCNLIADL
jgi:hypothetical protein